MNRSILIVICDFLLVSLLAFSSFDSSRLVEQNHQPALKLDKVPDLSGGSRDMLGVLKLALDDERRQRDQLLGELSQTKQAVRGQENLLVERQQQIQSMQERLQQKEAETQTLAQERNAMQQQFAQVQTNVAVLQKQLQERSTETLLSQEKIAALQAELRQQQQAAAAMQTKLSAVEKQREAVQAEKQQLVTQLQVAETEKRLTREQLGELRGEVQTVRQEKTKVQEHAAKLAEGVTSLAQKSGELTQELRANRALTPNTIFNELVTNRIHTQFEAKRSGFLGLDLNKQATAETILISQGTNIYALYHIEDTPLTLLNPGTDWQTLTGVVSRNSVAFSMFRVSFASLDPRVMLVPTGKPQAQQLGCKIYPVAADPFKFQEAVLVGAKEGYYGECRFQIDVSTPQYVKMDRGMFYRLVGKFNPSRGDLVLSKTGEFLGIMVNNSYCLVLNRFDVSRTIRFGPDVTDQRTGQVLAQLHDSLALLPLKLR